MNFFFFLNVVLAILELPVYIRLASDLCPTKAWKDFFLMPVFKGFFKDRFTKIWCKDKISLSRHSLLSSDKNVLFIAILQSVEQFCSPNSDCVMPLAGLLGCWAWL